VALLIREIEEELIVKLSGIFDYNVRTAFRDSYENYQPRKSNQYVLDFSDVSFIDSSALGMLLLMIDFVGTNRQHLDDSKIRLIHCSEQIKNIFEVARFHVLFDIS